MSNQGNIPRRGLTICDSIRLVSEEAKLSRENRRKGSEIMAALGDAELFRSGRYLGASSLSIPIFHHDIYKRN